MRAPVERVRQAGGPLRELISPDRSRWKPMLGGLGLALAGAHAASALGPSGPAWALLVLLVAFSWFVGACAMIGFVRWFFAAELARARREHGEGAKKEE
jgi:hypothetical protein